MKVREPSFGGIPNKEESKNLNTISSPPSVVNDFEAEKLKDAVHFKNMMQTMQNSQGIASMHDNKGSIGEAYNVFTSASNVDSTKN